MGRGFVVSEDHDTANGLVDTASCVNSNGAMDTASSTRTAATQQLAAEIGEFVTVAEVAEMFRVTDNTIYGLAEEGAFGEVIRIGRAIRIPVAGVRTFRANAAV